MYVRLLLEEAAKRGIPAVLATTREVLSDGRFTKHVVPALDQVELLLLPSRLTVKVLQRCARDASCDLVVVPDALKYGVRMQIGSAWSRPLVRLVMMNDPRWLPFAVSSRFALALLKKALMWVSDIRPGVDLLWLRPQGQLPTSKTIVDPVVLDGSVEELLAEAKAARRELRMSTSSFWFGVVGSLDARKNIPMVIRALSEASNLAPRQVALALLGPWSDSKTRIEVEAALRETGLEYVVLNEHFSNREMNVMLAAVDCVVMAYSTHAPNSTAAKAAALGVRTVVAGSVTFRRFNQQVGGLPGVPLEHHALSRELVAALNRTSPRPVELIGPEGLTGPCLADIWTIVPAPL